MERKSLAYFLWVWIAYNIGMLGYLTYKHGFYQMLTVEAPVRLAIFAAITFLIYLIWKRRQLRVR